MNYAETFSARILFPAELYRHSDESSIVCLLYGLVGDIFELHDGSKAIFEVLSNVRIILIQGAQNANDLRHYSRL